MAPLIRLMSSSHRTVESLVGEQLSAVVFVQDYVQFQFDGPGLTAFTNPIATTPDGQWRFPAPGARDALCASIARRVERVACQDDAALRLDFGGGYAITIPLDAASYRGPEVLLFQPEPGGPVQVWN
jgi:hypothetical protein